MVLLLAQDERSYEWLPQVIASVAVCFGAVVLRWALRRGIQSQHKMSPDMRRRWLLQVRNLTFLLITMGLVLIWATELRTVAISVVAFVVAMVIATKELILCLSGGFLKMSSRMFVLGDHIEIGAVRGEVIDQTLLTTKIMESTDGPNGQQFTGRLITLPNAVLLNQPVTNESLTKTFGLHVFTVPVKAEDDWEAHEAALQAALDTACKPYLDAAKRAVSELAVEDGLPAPSVDPRVHVSIPEPGRVNLIARLPYPMDTKGKVLQTVMRDYLQRAAALKQTPETPGPGNASDSAKL
jgi:small-conductance mechanosensitive channel